MSTPGDDWYQWGPYLSERQWGTVREDYSADGGAWGYLSHDHARSRAYRPFGLTGPEGNHGEDVKDYWWYLDAAPTHAWLRVGSTETRRSRRRRRPGWAVATPGGATSTRST